MSNPTHGLLSPWTVELKKASILVRGDKNMIHFLGLTLLILTGTQCYAADTPPPDTHSAKVEVTEPPPPSATQGYTGFQGQITLPVETYFTSAGGGRRDTCVFNGKSSWQSDSDSCTSTEDLQALILKKKQQWAQSGLQSFCKANTRLPASINNGLGYHQSRIRQARCSRSKRVEYELMCNACRRAKNN